MVAFNARVLLFIEAFTSNPMATSKQKLSDVKTAIVNTTKDRIITLTGCWGFSLISVIITK